MKITLKKSLIGSKKDQIATAASLGLKKVGDVCVCCGKPAKHMVYWGKQY